MKRIVSEKRLRQYAEKYPDAKPSLDRWEAIARAADWKDTADLKQSFNNVDPVIVKSGNTVYVFNIQGNNHRMIAAIHFNTGVVFVLRLMTHKKYDLQKWMDEL